MKPLEMLGATVLGLLVCLSSAVGQTLEPCQLPIAVHAYEPLVGQPLTDAKFSQPAEGSGVTNPGQAMVATFTTAIGPISIALDSTSAEGKRPDLVRFDFGGSGKFNDTDVAPFKAESMAPNYYRGQSTPVSLSFERDGRTIYVSPRVEYYKYGNQRHASLRMVVAGKAACRFGDQSRHVMVIDGNSNLRLDDVSQPGKEWLGVNPGDTLLIADEAGSLEGAGAQTILLGQPFMLGEKLYTVEVGPDGWSVTPKLYDQPTGMLQVAHERWEGVFAGRQHVVRLTGGNQPQPVPADAYAVVEYSEYPSGEQSKSPLSLQVEAGRIRPDRAKRCEVAAGQTAQMAVGSPLTVEPEVQVRDRQVTVGMKLADAAEAPNQVTVALTHAQEGRAKPPQVVIRDSAGKQVHSGKLEYG